MVQTCLTLGEKCTTLESEGDRAAAQENMERGCGQRYEWFEFKTYAMDHSL